MMLHTFQNVVLYLLRYPFRCSDGLAPTKLDVAPREKWPTKVTALSVDRNVESHFSHKKYNCSFLISVRFSCFVIHNPIVSLLTCASEHFPMYSTCTKMAQKTC